MPARIPVAYAVISSLSHVPDTQDSQDLQWMKTQVETAVGQDKCKSRPISWKPEHLADLGGCCHACRRSQRLVVHQDLGQKLEDIFNKESPEPLTDYSLAAPLSQERLIFASFLTQEAAFAILHGSFHQFMLSS